MNGESLPKEHGAPVRIIARLLDTPIVSSILVTGSLVP